jgi:UPF0271 protein
MLIDLNSDLGEGFGTWRMGDDDALMDVISSANVACGYHAGDPVIMDRTVRLALARGVDLGAHVSYPDLMGFGRRRIEMDLQELEKHVLYQLGALHGIAVAAGHHITHVNPHGALGNLACTDRDVADMLVHAVGAFDPDIAFLVMSGTEFESAAMRAGRCRRNLFLADRAYDASGQLVSMKVPGALIKDHDTVVARAMTLLEDGTLTTVEGGTLKVEAQSILVHSDTPGAVELARAIRRTIEASGHQVRPMSRIVP